MKLIHTMQELVQYERRNMIKVTGCSLEAVRGTGYGVVVPNLDEIEIAQPEVIHRGINMEIRSSQRVRLSI